MRKPDFFIVGAPKCGTTAMNSYLKQHPEIFIPDKKELHFFGRDLRFKAQRITLEKYLSYFAEAELEKRVGEASVWYLYSKYAAEEIKKFCTSAKIIIMLRNPVDMLYSQHSQFLYNGNEDIADFETALDAEKERKQGLRIPKTVRHIDGLYYRETIKYAEQVQRYLNIFGQENVHVIIFDDFKSNTADEYMKTLRFLGVSEKFSPNFSIVNANKRVRSPFLRSFLDNSPRVFAWLKKVAVLSNSIHKIRDGLKRLNTKYDARTAMDSSLRRRMQLEFKPEIERLSELLGRDLTHWIKG